MAAVTPQRGEAPKNDFNKTMRLGVVLTTNAQKQIRITLVQA